MATCVFTKDQHVVYGSNGICTVEDIKRMSFIKGDPEKVYYILRPKNDKNSTIYIPEDNEMLMSKMRAPVSAEEVALMASEADSGECEWIEDRKQRSAHYRELLSNPHPSLLLPIIKAIAKKHGELTEAGKKLAAADRETFEAAMRFIKDEFTFATGSDEKASEYIKMAVGSLPHIA